MQYKQLAAVAAFAGLANGQAACTPIVPQIPGCLLGYVASAAYYSQSCDIPDIQCQAGNTDNYMSIVNTAIPAAAMTQPGAPSACAGMDILNSALDIGSSLTSCAAEHSTDPPITLNAAQSACQSLALSIPPCALGFIAEAGYSSHSCAVQDFACQCSNSQSIQLEVLTDVQNYCGGGALGNILASVSNVCNCVASQGTSGPSSTTPTDPGVTSTTSGTSTPSGTQSTTASPSGSSTGPSQTSSPSGSKSGSSTGTGSKTGGPSGSQSSGTSPSGSNPPTTPGPAKQSSTTGSNPGGSKSMPLFTNAGATASAFGGIFGIVAGAVAFL